MTKSSHIPILCHLTSQLLDRVVRGANFLSGGHVTYNLSHRRDVASLCMFYKIVSNRVHPICSSLPKTFVPAKVTRRSVSLHNRAVVPVRYRTDQYGRWFMARVVGMWNTLNNTVFVGVGLSTFKPSGPSTRANLNADLPALTGMRRQERACGHQDCTPSSQ